MDRHTEQYSTKHCTLVSTAVYNRAVVYLRHELYFNSQLYIVYLYSVHCTLLIVSLKGHVRRTVNVHAGRCCVHLHRSCICNNCSNKSHTVVIHTYITQRIGLIKCVRSLLLIACGFAWNCTEKKLGQKSCKKKHCTLYSYALQYNICLKQAVSTQQIPVNRDLHYCTCTFGWSRRSTCIHVHAFQCSCIVHVLYYTRDCLGDMG